jgi:NADH dehydrogenase FAD-containing subunit
VPPRAQAAHIARQIERRLRGQAIRPYTYRDFGSLVSLGKWSTVGNLMGFLFGRWRRSCTARCGYCPSGRSTEHRALCWVLLCVR